MSEAEAVKAAKRQCPDLICADVTLTDGCGIKAVQDICADDAVPTIYVTGAPYRVLTSDRHANVVTNPFTLSEIHTAVRRALGSPNKWNDQICCHRSTRYDGVDYRSRVNPPWHRCFEKDRGRGRGSTIQQIWH